VLINSGPHIGFDANTISHDDPMTAAKSRTL
jgi:hypothetical protein